MTDGPSRLHLKWKDADAMMNAIHSQSPVTGLTHNYYKYPARFSPAFAAAAIDVFTDPGDLVVDPFVGGGTTLVEARVSGRLGIGSDISRLATFVASAKTNVFSPKDIEYLGLWCSQLPYRINLGRQSESRQWKEIGYTRNLDCKFTWRVRRAIELALDEVNQIPCPKRQSFARCLVLRTAQWAIDGRKEIPSVESFRTRLRYLANDLLNGAAEYAMRAKRADRTTSANYLRRSVCLNTRAEGLADYVKTKKRDCPKLIVTSPPYPGVHILYHRWQVHGGKETPAPFWIANQLDGAGEAYYLMHARRTELIRYHQGIATAFSELAKVACRDTVLIQLVAFSDPSEQMPRYLDTLSKCGFRECVLSDHVDSRDGRIWRNVPGRRWHANSKEGLHSGKEVVLIHRPR